MYLAELCILLLSLILEERAKLSFYELAQAGEKESIG